MGCESTRTKPVSKRAPTEKSLAAVAPSVKEPTFGVCPLSRLGMGCSILMEAVAPSPVETSCSGGLMPTSLFWP